MSKSIQRNGTLIRVWETTRTLLTSGSTDVPDFRGIGQDIEVFERVAWVCFQSILPRKAWLSNYNKKVLSEYVTVADEALAYLILENNLDDWLKIARHEVEDVKTRKRTTKYTVVSSNNRVGGTKKGWTKEGKLRYNKYYDVIEKARERDRVKAMEIELLEKWKEGCDKGTDVVEIPKENDESFKPRSGFDISKISAVLL